MVTKKARIMPYIVVCGSGLLNLLLMSLPFLNNHGSNISGYVLISYSEGFGVLQLFVAVFQVLIMLIAYGMLFYGAIGILYAAGVTGIDMSKPKFRYFCSIPIILINLLYVIQFILIAINALNNNTWIGMGVYMSLFLNVGITLMSVVLQKEPKPSKPTIQGDND